MPEYMLLLRDNPNAWTSLSPEEMQAATEKYMAWMHLPYVTGGQRLQNSGRVMCAADGLKVHDGPFGEAKEILGGFYTIKAASYDEAVTLAESHPHLAFGTVEVREVY